MSSLTESILASIANISLVEEMYERFQANPQDVGDEWRLFFTEFDRVSEEDLIGIKASNGGPKLKEFSSSKKKSAPVRKRVFPTSNSATPSSELSTEAVPVLAGAAAYDLRIYNLIHYYRMHGHLLANINPVATHDPEGAENFAIERHGFKKSELMSYFPTFGFLDKEEAPLQDIIGVLKEIYCNKIGVEYMDVDNPELEKWLQDCIEPSRFKADLTIDQKQMILQQLNKSELFESFIHTKFVGQKRFSLEGGETLIPVLMAVIESGSDLEVEEFAIAMAHRGRLNVLSNILNKSHAEIFSEFEASYIEGSFGGSGDVKYHKGFAADIKTSKGHIVRVSVAENPSHLEAVNAVVEGFVRGRLVEKGDDKTLKSVVPVIIHGDAAIAGQGIVYECMQLGHLAGYETGGVIHIVINNQIGFTTLPKDSRSTHYCTDVSRAFGAPVFHVNAEDPEGCVYATNLAMQVRDKFQCDVFIDLNCYRKYGHNEGDEPAFTQPLQYQRIRKKKPIRELYRETLINQGVLEKYMAGVLEEEFKTSLQEAQKVSKSFDVSKRKEVEEPLPRPNMLAPIKTAVPLKVMQKLAEKFCSIPKGFNANSKIVRLMKQRLEMVNSKAKKVDWGMGEHLAFATLLWDNVHVRISGQDSRRGTFSHRHAMWMDQKQEKKFFPLNHIKKGQKRFDVFNSPLSEYAVLGFEFGYTMARRDALVMWEAQFGDFANGAQIIIDQFVATSEQKWGDSSRLVMLLPHGYEGQGPEHSSARIERFLQLCGDDNMQVVNPTSPAQLFHLLRRQGLRDFCKPLIVFTPKGLLRHPECVSSIKKFSTGTFEELIDDPTPPKKAKRVLFCSGRIYYDIFAERERREIKNVAIVRVEQMYPLHMDKIKKIVQGYELMKECFWVQEEPRNMGAWHFIRPFIQKELPKGIEMQFVGRPRSASPAAGSLALHQQEHVQLMNKVFVDEHQDLYEMAYDSMNV